MVMNLKELAAELRLSQTTVSRALNGYPEVNERTRKRVLAAARRFDYKPSTTARRLATGCSHVLGYVFPVDGASALDPLFVEYLAGAAETCVPASYEVAICPTTVADELSVFQRLIADDRIDALLVSAPRVRDERVTLLRKVGFPFVVHGRPPDARDCYYLDIDNIMAFRDATERLITLGHRRVAVLNGDSRLTYAFDRAKGASAAFAAAGLDDAGLTIRSMPNAVDAVSHLTGEILDRPDRPTALLCSSVIMAIGALSAAADRGFAVPRDLSIIAHDDQMPAFCPDRLNPPLTTTSSSIRAAGARVAEIAIGIATGQPPASMSEVWPVAFVDRASTAPAPEAI
jgi:LacI family transcriptional regulator